MLTGILSKVAIGWFLRRILDWGGWIGTLLMFFIGIFNAMPPAQQAAVQEVISGHWQNVTLGTLIPLVVLIFSQVMSFRATTKNQIVLEGDKVSVDKLPPSTQAVVDQITQIAAETKGHQPTIFDTIFKRR